MAPNDHHCESRWLIDLVHDRAYSIGQSMDQALRTFLGDAMSQPRGSFAEGLVMGLRQLLTRISALGPLWPLLLLVASGFWYEARALRALAAQRFVYISPLRYRRIAGLPWVYLMLAMADGWLLYRCIRWDWRPCCYRLLAPLRRAMCDI